MSPGSRSLTWHAYSGANAHVCPKRGRGKERERDRQAEDMSSESMASVSVLRDTEMVAKSNQQLLHGHVATKRSHALCSQSECRELGINRALKTNS